MLKISRGLVVALWIPTDPEGRVIDSAPETIAAFTDRAPMAGVKQSGAEFSYHQDLIRLGRERNFPVFTGADLRLPETLGLGCAGTISGLANLTPDLLRDLFQAWNSGNSDPVAAVDRKIKRVGEVIGQLPFPIDISAAVPARVLEPGGRKSVVSAGTQQRHDRLAAEMRAQLAEWGLAPAA
jgi:4-hydroxy-tetrahydrodipicolinate synthase